MTEKQLKELLVGEEQRIIKGATKYCGEHKLEFSRDHNKLVRCIMRKFYRETIYPHLRELNINAPREYDK